MHSVALKNYFGSNDRQTKFKIHFKLKWHRCEAGENNTRYCLRLLLVQKLLIRLKGPGTFIKNHYLMYFKLKKVLKQQGFWFLFATAPYNIWAQQKHSWEIFIPNESRCAFCLFEDFSPGWKDRKTKYEIHVWVEIKQSSVGENVGTIFDNSWSDSKDHYLYQK